MIEWYDFYIFGSLATVIASKFYQTGTPLGDLIAWLATFAIGFVVRPFGAIFFGRIGDLIGRKYTFLINMTLMGLCTFAVGLLPTYETLGAAARIILITLRILQGLALGGEYVGPEHAFLHDTGRIRYTAVSDAEALEAFQLLSRLEGIIPALESAHAVAELVRLTPELEDNSVVVINLSGRGDKDVEQVSRVIGDTLDSAVSQSS